MKQWQVRRKNDILSTVTSFKEGADRLKYFFGSFTLGIQYGWRVIKVTLFPHDWSASRMGDHECAKCEIWISGHHERPEYGCI